MIGDGVAADIAVFAAAALTLVAFTQAFWFVLVAQYLLVVVVITRSWFAQRGPNLSLTDNVVAALALVYLMRLLFGEHSLALTRIPVLYTGILLYWLGRTVRHGRLILRWTALFITVSSALLSMLWIVRCYEWMGVVRSAGFPDVTALKGRIASILGGPTNEWATILLLALVYQMATLSPVSRGFVTRNLVPIIALPVTSVALLLTFSRGAYLSLLVLAAGVLAYLCYARFRLRSRFLLGAVVIFALPVGAAFTDILSGGAVKKTAMIGATEQQRRSSAGRLQVWSSSLKMASDEWILGTGPGTFAMHFVPEAGLGEGRSFVGRPLNTFLTIQTEEGMVGIVLYFLLTATAAFVAVRSSPCVRGAKAWPTAVLLVGLCAFWVREMTFSSLLENALVSSLFFLLLGFLVNVASSSAARFRTVALNRRAAVLVTVLAAAGGVMFYASARQRSADTIATSAAQLLAEGKWERASVVAQKAIQKHETPYYRSVLALSTAIDNGLSFNARNPFQTVQPQEQRRRLQASLTDYDRAIAANPNDDLFWHNRAWIRITLGAAPSNVVSDVRRAIAIDGAASAYRVTLGLIYEREGRSNEAVTQYGAALAESPALADSEFARDLQRRDVALWKSSLVNAVTVLRGRDPESHDIVVRARLGRLYFEQGELGRAHDLLVSVVETMPQLPRAWSNLGLVQLRGNNLDQAEESLRKAAFLDPGDPIVWKLLADAAAARGDKERAEELSSRGAVAARYLFSSHASRVGRVYMTAAVVRDDILPAGLLTYCSPSTAFTRP
jgi:tetratricopeptide (TPR) repeat protein/O-antigen ligase